MKNLNLLFYLIFSLILHPLVAQGPPWGGGGGGKMSDMRIGRIYGKVVDENGKAVEYASVQLSGKKFDRKTFSLKDTVWAGQLTAGNGDFNIEKLPVIGEYTLVISFLGYAESKQKVDFGMPMSNFKKGGGRPGQSAKKDSTQKKSGPSGRPTGGPPSGRGGFPSFSGGSFEKDLGNIQLKVQVSDLEEVEIVGKANMATLSLDKKIFRVDRDLTTAGGTAEDALRNVPSLSIDLDGNVSLRNGAPQILVDGRQTTLSLEQIPASSIETVEVITNPSAKYDAGGGTAGIVNIVLKKNKRLGYNGNIRMGGDSRGGANLSGDINARSEKVNLFASVMGFRSRRAGEGETFRENFFGEPASNLTQLSDQLTKGFFGRGRAGMDVFLSNRNTLTLSGSYMRGQFSPTDVIANTTDFLFPDSTVTDFYTRTSNTNRGFRNYGVSAQFKHLFPKKGAEWTADVFYNEVRFEGDNDFLTAYASGFESQEQQTNLGEGSFMTLQTDFVKPIGTKSKLEGGLKATLRNNQNDNQNSIFDKTQNAWVNIDQLADHFAYNDNIYAAYLQGSQKGKKWGFQAGVRAESSFYTGELTDRDSSFSINYPISLFPSIFLTRQLKGNNQFQLAYTRRVNRPNFFQTMPFVDFSDSLNLRRGEPRLLPEFTNSVELSYQNKFKKGNLLMSVYYKQATNLITSYQFTEFNEALGREVVIISYTNSDNAAAYGAEITLRNNITDWLDITTNINLYQSEVDASNVESGLEISQLSGFWKETVQLTLPKGYSFQLNGEYRSRASFTPTTNNSPWRRGGASTNSAQGYSKALWFMAASVKKSFLDNKASLTVSVQDIFATRRYGSVTISDFFTQEASRIRNPQLVKVNFSYRFGKMDISLFRRKNNRRNTQGSDMMGG